jgi:hypothetical protein
MQLNDFALSGRSVSLAVARAIPLRQFTFRRLRTLEIGGEIGHVMATASPTTFPSLERIVFGNVGEWTSRVLAAPAYASVRSVQVYMEHDVEYKDFEAEDADEDDPDYDEGEDVDEDEPFERTAARVESVMDSLRKMGLDVSAVEEW